METREKMMDEQGEEIIRYEDVEICDYVILRMGEQHFNMMGFVVEKREVFVNEEKKRFLGLYIRKNKVQYVDMEDVDAVDSIMKQVVPYAKTDEEGQE